MESPRYDLMLQTDAYHHTMGRLIARADQPESYVLYARRGGPQVVADMAMLLERVLRSVPTPAEVAEAADFWASQGIPFPVDAWRGLSERGRLPLQVRGVVDGQVVMPGDPIAVLSGPSFLVAALEPVLEGELMTSMQVATRWVKCAAAVGWDTDRLFEVGLRSATGPADHLRKLGVLARLGLRQTSSGEGARTWGLHAVGTMGHRYTQRFTGHGADEAAFDNAVSRMLAVRRQRDEGGTLPLSFLLDTRSTLGSGLPAALRVLAARAPEIHGALRVSVRLDSGDLHAQFARVVDALKGFDAGHPGIRPGIIVESGLAAADLARFESMSTTLGFDRRRVSYGLGGYLVGGLDRDRIALVYKLASFGEACPGDGDLQTATMKFGDDTGAGKASYPGEFELWEAPDRRRTLALVSEHRAMRAGGLTPLFVPLVRDGVLQAIARCGASEVRERARQRWRELTANYTGEGHYYETPDGRPVTRPAFSPAMDALVDRLRAYRAGTTDPLAGAA